MILTAIWIVLVLILLGSCALNFRQALKINTQSQETAKQLETIPSDTYLILLKAHRTMIKSWFMAISCVCILTIGTISSIYTKHELLKYFKQVSTQNLTLP